LSKDRRYWNKEMETIGPTDLARLGLKMLNRQLAYIKTHSRFYRDKFRAAKQEIEGMSDLKGLQAFPFTTKDELRTSQERSPPFGDYCAQSIDMIVRVHRTSGTSGRPLFLGLSRHDLQVINECGARAFWSGGLRPGMKVIHCLNYSLWLGGFTDHSSLETVGAAVIPFGVGQSRQLIATMKALRVDAISATTSYPGLLAKIMREELFEAPRSLGLKLALLGGEIGVGIPSFRKALEETWGMKAVDANFGLADVLSIFGAECDYRDGLHFLGQGAIICEIRDTRTGEIQELRDGVEGEMVLTNLDKEIQPLLRYRTGDMIQVITTDKCSCGRTGFRLKVLGRTQDVLKVKGLNIYISAIQDVVASFAPSTTGEFQVLLDSPPPIRRLLIKVELAEGSGAKKEELANALRRTMKEKLGIEAEFEVVEPNSLPRFEGKTQRLIRTYE
jgi:phenylacetate-CoA ligase